MKQCPICEKATIEEFSPFCSLRCKQIDLGKWFNESYYIPAQNQQDIEEEEI